MNGLVVKNLSVSYGNRQILHNISFELPSGSILGIIGPNGSGKTTLGKVIASLIPAREGTILWNDVPLANQPIEAVARIVGYLFQNPNTSLFAPTVLEEFRFDLKLDESEINTLIKQFNLSRYRNTPPRRLSRGEKQRLALALVVARNVELLILDEPFSGIDPLHRRYLWRHLLGEVQDQRTLFLITHDLSSIIEFSTHIIGLKEGQIAFNGSSADLFSSDYLSSIGFHLPLSYYLLKKMREEGLVSSTISSIAQVQKYFKAQSDYDKK